MKRPLTHGAHRILHDLFSKGAMFKSALNREKLPELEERGYVAIHAGHFVYLTPTGQQYAIESFLSEHPTSSSPASKFVGAVSRVFERRELAKGGWVFKPEGLSINNATIRGNIRSAAHVCGNTIEQETLSKVLIHTLPNIQQDKAKDIANELAAAISGAFNVLKKSGGDWKIKQDGQLLSKDQTAENLGGDGKLSSTYTLKVRLDTSDAIESINGLSKEISDLVDTAIANSLKPGGRLHGPMRGNDDLVADVVSLRAQVAKLDSAFQNVCLSIADLNNRMAARITGDVHASPV